MANLIGRRQFITGTGAGLLGLGAAQWLSSCPMACAAPAPAPSRRIGAVAYNYQYSIGLFTYKDRPGPRMDNVGFIEAVHQAGGNVVQIFGPTLAGLAPEELQGIRERAGALDVAIEVHGGGAQPATYPKIMEQAAALGVKVIGCTFGMLMRPDKIATLEAWDAHMAACEKRLRELIPQAKRLGMKIGIENHLDFSLEELHGLLQRIDSPEVGVFFDVGNWLGTLDDPIAAAELLGPYTLATHYKDFAVEETPQGFRLTMVALGNGSLDLPGITAALLKTLRPEANMSIEMMNGQQLDIKWLEPAFLAAFRGKTGAQVAATLRHIRRQKVNLAEVRGIEEIDKMPHEEHLAFEARQSQRCIEYLKKLLNDQKGA